MDNSSSETREDAHLALVGRALVEAADRKLRDALVLLDIAGVAVAAAHISQARDNLTIYLMGSQDDG